MSLQDTQKQVDDWIEQHKIEYFKPLEILARLTEETGELARELNHRFGPKKKKPAEEVKEVGDEIGDCGAQGLKPRTSREKSSLFSWHRKICRFFSCSALLR